MSKGEMIPVTSKVDTAGVVTQSVDARALHKALGVETEFAKWIERRIEEYEFLAPRDYSSSLTTNGKRGRPEKSYQLTLATAKELCMVERTERGRATRKYFIECEERLLAQRAETSDAKHLLDRVLRLEAAKDSPRLWQDDVILSLCKTYGIPRDKPGWPNTLSGVAGWIYRVILGEKVYSELKARNPGRGADRKGMNYQFFQACLRTVVIDDLRVVLALSNTASNKDDFKARMLAHYRKKPFQLLLGGAA